MKKKIIVSIVVLSLLAVGIASAALLTYFGVITTTANVEQAVTLLGNTEHTIPEAAPGGESFCFLHKLDNDASIDVDVDFEMDCDCIVDEVGDCEGIGDVCEGITQTAYKVPETRTLELCEKDTTTWQCNSGATATLTFDPVNPRFVGTLTTTGLSGDYALIYYPDQADRFDPLKWNGNGGIVITTFIDDVINSPIDKDLGMNLPKSTDWNVNPIPDYCNDNNGYDSYVHCKGAKIWIVPTSDLTGGTDLPLVSWNPSSYLFEEDLITYFDCNETIEDFAVDMEEGAPVTTLTTKSRTLTPFLVCYDFDVAIAPGTYVITTGIKPS